MKSLNNCIVVVGGGSVAVVGGGGGVCVERENMTVPWVSGQDLTLCQKTGLGVTEQRQ